MAKALSTFDIANARGVNINPWQDLMFKSLDVSNKQYTPEEANQTFDVIRNLPEYQAQQSGVSDLENELQRLKDTPRVNDDPWVKPLLALVDSETGSKLMSGYTPPEANKNRNEMILKYQDAIANRKKQSADTLMAGLGKFKSGTKTDIGGTDIAPAKIGAQMATADAGNQTKLDSALISAAARKKSGQGKNIYEDEFARSGAKDATKFLTSGGKSKYTSMANEIEGIASTLEAKKGNLISPTGFGGAIQSFAAGALDPEVASAMDKIDALSVEISSPDFKGATSDRDAKIMAGGLVSKRGDEKDIAGKLRQKANTIKHIGEKQELKFKIQSQGGSSSDVERALKAADDAFYGGQGPVSNTSSKSMGPKEGDKKTLKSGKVATFKGGQWQL